MPSFQDMFTKTKGLPIVYQGQTLVMSDRFATNGMMKFRLIFEASSGEWRQGIALNCDGNFIFRGEIFDGKNGLVFWRDSAPDSVEFEVESSVTMLRVYNVWDVGDSVVHAMHNGAAMIIEEVPNGRRYRCNDGFADDDFDDIVFRLERLEP